MSGVVAGQIGQCADPLVQLPQETRLARTPRAEQRHAQRRFGGPVGDHGGERSDVLPETQQVARAGFVARRGRSRRWFRGLGEPGACHLLAGQMVPHPDGAVLTDAHDVFAVGHDGEVAYGTDVSVEDRRILWPGAVPHQQRAVVRRGEDMRVAVSERHRRHGGHVSGEPDEFGFLLGAPQDHGAVGSACEEVAVVRLAHRHGRHGARADVPDAAGAQLHHVGALAFDTDRDAGGLRGGGDRVDPHPGGVHRAGRVARHVVQHHVTVGQARHDGALGRLPGGAGRGGQSPL